MLSRLFSPLDGYKMYAVGTIVVLTGIVEGLLGFDIPGVEVGPDWLNYIMGGIAMFAAKSAIAKT